MPIEKKEGESKDDFISRCMSKEIEAGKEQDQAYAICITKYEEYGTQSVTDNTWSTEAPISINMTKVSFDYDDTLSTAKGKEMAKSAIFRGDTVYIISARRDKSGLLATADELGIPHSRVFATGSNKAKEEKVKELGITRHIDVLTFFICLVLMRLFMILEYTLQVSLKCILKLMRALFLIYQTKSFLRQYILQTVSLKMEQQKPTSTYKVSLYLL